MIRADRFDEFGQLPIRLRTRRRLKWIFFIWSQAIGLSYDSPLRSRHHASSSSRSSIEAVPAAVAEIGCAHTIPG